MTQEEIIAYYQDKIDIQTAKKADAEERLRVLYEKRDTKIAKLTDYLRAIEEKAVLDLIIKAGEPTLND